MLLTNTEIPKKYIDVSSVNQVHTQTQKYWKTSGRPFREPSWLHQELIVSDDGSLVGETYVETFLGVYVTLLLVYRTLGL